MKRFLFALSALSVLMIAPPSSRAGTVYTVKNLGTLGGTYGYCEGVNDSGQVAGDSLTAGGVAHAFLSGVNGGALTDLGTLGGTEAMAMA